MFKGKEIVRLMLIAALCCVLMIAAVTVYLVLSSRQHLENQAEKMEQELTDTIARKLDTAFNNITTYLKETPAVPMSDEAYVIVHDTKRVIRFFAGCAWAMYDTDYAVEVSESGEVYTSFTGEGWDMADFPMETVIGMDGSDDSYGYVILDSIGGVPGSYIIMARDMLVPTLGEDMRLGLVINATDQVEALSKVYDEDKSDMITRQVAVSIAIFLVLLALSILIIYLTIRRRLSGPIASINANARKIMTGKEADAIEPDEKSIFYNLQLLLKSGSVIFRKSGPGQAEGTTAPQTRGGGSEVRKVLVFWIILFSVISAVSVAALVATSIAMMNSKTNALKESVVEQTADYYEQALDSTFDYVLASAADALVGQALWDPDPNAPIDRAKTMERMRNLLKYSYNAEYVAYINDQEVAYSTEETADLPGLPEQYAEGYTILRSFDGEEGTYIGLCKKTDYPFIGPEDQYVYTVVDITTQTDAIAGLYEDSRSALLWSQLIVAFILLVLSALLAAFGIGWAVQRYVAAPVRELDELSSKVMEGSLEEDVTVDESSSFADIQRLLRQGQELLRQMNVE